MTCGVWCSVLSATANSEARALIKRLQVCCERGPCGAGIGTSKWAAVHTVEIDRHACMACGALAGASSRLTSRRRTWTPSFWRQRVDFYLFRIARMNDPPRPPPLHLTVQLCVRRPRSLHAAHGAGPVPGQSCAAPARSPGFDTWIFLPPILRPGEL